MLNLIWMLGSSSPSRSPKRASIMCRAHGRSANDGCTHFTQATQCGWSVHGASCSLLAAFESLVYSRFSDTPSSSACKMREEDE
ncbi:hypothetical protein HPP92_021738 [Vanilla planifolia]|uniref:Uncharacterized protein n=1 Tax=Vanilla planifolia TaxID=51239 RepID=A0A835UJA0_VANPL|nr:hypothetical protein HPP92_021738 [Vanilla planifolia]